jgi:hypothetical protein
MLEGADLLNVMTHRNISFSCWPNNDRAFQLTLIDHPCSRSPMRNCASSGARAATKVTLKFFRQTSEPGIHTPARSKNSRIAPIVGCCRRKAYPGTTRGKNSRYRL